MTDFFSAPFTATPVAGIRQRRDWGQDFADLPELLGWFSARAAHVTKDGSNNVTQMADRSGNAKPLVIIPSSGTTKCPTFAPEGGPNRSPSISFNGVNDVLQWGTATGAAGNVPTTGDFSKVVIFKTASVPAGAMQIFSRSNTQAQSLYVLADKIYGQIGTNPSPFAVANAPFTPLAWQLVIQSFDYSTGTVKLSVNGSAVSSATVAGAVTNQNPAYLGGSTSTPANPFAGDIAELLVFNTDILDDANAATRAMVEQFARDVRAINF